MSRLDRLLAAAFITVILGIQLAVILPPMTQSVWYWPFLNYPMYAKPHHRGEQFVLRKLRMVRCTPGAPARIVGWQEIHLLPFIYEGYLQRAVASGDSATGRASPDSARAALSRYVQRTFSDACALQVLTQTARLGDPDTYAVHGDYVLVGEWSVPSASRRTSNGLDDPLQ